MKKDFVPLALLVLISLVGEVGGVVRRSSIKPGLSESRCLSVQVPMARRCPCVSGSSISLLRLKNEILNHDLYIAVSLPLQSHIA